MTFRRIIHALMLGLVASVLVGLGTPAQAGSELALDLDCDNFPNQRAAQIYLNNHPGDPDGLDSENDGRACESLPCPCYFGSGDPDPDPMPEPPKPKPVVIRVVKVINGQLVKIREGKKPSVVVHLVGASVPKSACEFRGARQDLRSYVKPGTIVDMIDDKRAPNADPQGRLFRYLVKVKSGWDLGGSQIFRGFADVDRSIKFEDAKRYRRFEDKAVTQLKGYHGTC